MLQVRHPAVAGMFYPADPGELESAVRGYLALAASAAESPGRPPKAIIAPHAGYIYSGPIAAAAYAAVESRRNGISRVVLIGPAHRVAFPGLALPTADGFGTPLGTVSVDRAAADRVLELPQVRLDDEAHRQEHSLEVHLPFLQAILGDFTLVPLVAGAASIDEVAEVLELLWGGDETLIVVSSDLSHYRSYETAQEFDAATSRAIERLSAGEIDSDHACGCVPVGGLLAVARRRKMTARTLDLRNSGDTAGPRSEVVGYGAYAIA